MPANTNLPAGAAKEPDAKLPVPMGVRIVGTVVRTLFLLVLTGLTARVASPQIETLSSLYETPDDLIRVALGLGVCTFFVVNLFILPKDPGAYWTWMYLGPAVLPLSLLCAFVVW